MIMSEQENQEPQAPTSFVDSVMAATSNEAPAPEPPKEAPAKVDEPAAGTVDQETEAPSTETEVTQDKSSDQNWKALRDAKKALEADKLSALAEIDRLKGNLSKFDQAEIDKLRSDYDSLSAELATVDAYRSPEVKAAKERAEATASDTVKAIRRLIPEAEGLEKALALPADQRDAKLASLLEEASPAAAARVWTQVDRLDEAHASVDALAESARAKGADWKAEQTQRQEAERAQLAEQTDQLFQAGLQAAVEEMPELFSLDGTDEQKQQTSDRINYAKQVLTAQMSPEETVQTAFLAGIGKTALVREKAFTAAVVELKSANEELQARISELEAAEPGGGSSPADGGAPEIKAGTFADTIMSMTSG